MPYKKTSYTVAVTGFGSFRQFGHNPSPQIRDGLPSQITRTGQPTINILKYPYNINSIYTEILALSPELWNGRKSVYEPSSRSDKALDIDLMVHIGMHPDDDTYYVEKRARNGKYEHAGDDGRFLSKDNLKGQPEKLYVGFDVDDVVDRMQQLVHDDEITFKASNDAGLYVCELISYLSLNELRKKNEFGRVVFLHVPKLNTEDAVRRGVEVAVALITACVERLPGDYRLR